MEMKKLIESLEKRENELWENLQRTKACGWHESRKNSKNYVYYQQDLIRWNEAKATLDFVKGQYDLEYYEKGI